MLRSCLVLLLLLCALTSCVRASRDEGFRSLARKSEGLCWWRNARWEDRAPLLVSGTGEPFARARARWNGQTWKGSNTTGVLRRAGPLVALQGEWFGSGVTLNAFADLSAQAVFRTGEPNRVGAAGLLLKGGHVRIIDALAGRALVLPALESMAAFNLEQSPALELPCEALSLSASLEPEGDAARRLLARSGFPADAPEYWLHQERSLPASEEAGGATIGHFVAGARPLRGFVVQQKQDEARLVVPTVDGVVWVGWVATAGLTPGAAEAPEPPQARGVPDRTAGQWRTCDHELPLRLESKGQLVEVGWLAAGTPFSLRAPFGDHNGVALAVEWLELEPEVRLLVPARARACALKQLSSL